MENHLVVLKLTIAAFIFLSKGNTAQDNLIGPSPSELVILAGTDHTMECILRPNGTIVLITWNELVSTVGYKQIFVGPSKSGDARYDNFELDSDNATYWNLNIRSVESDQEGTYFCSNFGTEESHQVVRIVEVMSNSTLMTQNGAEVTTVVVVTGESSYIVCSAIGARPAVVIDWYHQLPGGYESQIIDGVSQVNYTNSADGYTFDTVSTLQYNASQDYNGGTLRCVTTGQVVAESRESVAFLNVQYVPSVEVLFANEIVTCISDANPETTTYVITINNTDEYTLRRSGGLCTLSLRVEFDTEIRCNTSNDLGTGTAATKAVPTVTDTSTHTLSFAVSTNPTSPAETDWTTDVHFGAVLGGVLGALLVICIVVIIIFVFLFVIRKNNNTNKTDSPQNVVPIEESSPTLLRTYTELDPQTCEYESPYQQPLPQTQNQPFEIIATDTTPREDMPTYEEIGTNQSQGHGTASLPQAYMALDPLTRENTSAYQELDTSKKSGGHQTSDSPQAYMALDSSSRVETTAYHELKTHTAAIKRQGNQHEAYKENIGTELKDQVYNEIGEASYCQDYVNV